MNRTEPQLKPRLKGVLLVNLGTPDEPSFSAVHRYLVEFLTDPRVIDYPYWQRQLLVRGLIIPLRLKNTTHSYAKIWSDLGSPLLAYGEKVKSLLQEKLGPDTRVALAMRYQNPSIEKALKELMLAGIDELIVLPLFPQYASATTGSVFEKVSQALSRYETIPTLKFINSFYDDPGFLAAHAAVASPINLARYDKILFSFHGLPKRHLLKADCQGVCFQNKTCCDVISSQNRNCYRAACYATAHGIAKKIGLEKDRYLITFQSRLGKEEWMTPYTSETIEALGKEGHKRLLVFSPSFVCDCLETLYEISIEYQHLFKKVQGAELDLVPSLNDHPAWINALANLVMTYEVQPIALERAALEALPV